MAIRVVEGIARPDCFASFPPGRIVGLLQILTGPDDYSIAQAVDVLKKEAEAESAFGSAVLTLDGREVTPEQLRNAVCTAPFFGGKRAVVVRGLLERFEPRGRSSRQPSKTAVRNEEEYKPFSASLDNIPDSTVVVLVEGNIGNANPLYKELAKKGSVKTFPDLKGESLKQWVQQHVRESGGQVSPRAVDLLVRMVGSNLWSMAGEIEKLVLFCAGRRIEEDDVKILVSEVEQTSVFEMVDAILEARPEAASRSLQQLLNNGAAPSYLLFMLCRQVRLAMRAKELLKLKMPEFEMQKRLGLSAPFILRKTIEQAGRHSLETLKSVYRRLLETDLWIKTGRYDGELAIEITVAELCRRQPSGIVRAVRPRVSQTV